MIITDMVASIRLFLCTTFLLVFVLNLTAQSPGPTPAVSFGSYGEALVAGRAAFDKGLFPTAEMAYNEAVRLAANDEQRADALIALGGAVEKQSRTVRTGGSKSAGSVRYVGRYDDALVIYKKAVDLAAVADTKKAEAILRIGDIYAKSHKNKDLPRPGGLYGKPLSETAREEFSRVLALPRSSPDQKAQALISRAQTYNLRPAFGRIDYKQIEAAGKDLESVLSVDGASDELKADAMFELSDIAGTIKDAQVYFASNTKVTQLPAARPDQKIKAYDNIALAYLEGSKLPEARKALSEALALKNSKPIDRGKILRDLALAHLIDPANAPAGSEKGLKAARAELDKAVNIPRLADKEKSEIRMAAAIYFGGLKVAGASALAIGEFEKVTAMTGLTEKEKAVAHYEIGEVYRKNNQNSEAKTAYMKVSEANPQYHSYAQQRIKQIDSPPPPARSN